MSASAPPQSDESTETITASQYNNENDYLERVNELKEQFDAMKRDTNIEIARLKRRINHLVDVNTTLDYKNMKLTNMFMRLSDTHFKGNMTWR